MLLEEIGARCRQEANAAAADEFLRRARRAKKLVRGLQNLLHKGRTALT